MQKIQAQIRYEEDTIDLLKADWSLLTQPSGCRSSLNTTSRSSRSSRSTPRQIVALDDLPARPLDIEDRPRTASGSAAWPTIPEAPAARIPS